VESGLRVCPNSQTSNSRETSSSVKSSSYRVSTASGPLWVSRIGKEDSTLSRVTVRNGGAWEKTTCADIDSRKVAIKVGNLQGVCYNSPAESVRSENGSRCSPRPTLGWRRRQVERGGECVEACLWGQAERSLVQILIGVAINLYTDHWRGEGFRGHWNSPRVTRS